MRMLHLFLNLRYRDGGHPHISEAQDGGTASRVAVLGMEGADADALC
jgi:hypothetical protein